LGSQILLQTLEVRLQTSELWFSAVLFLREFLPLQSNF
jgi:hypothetical protein